MKTKVTLSLNQQDADHATKRLYELYDAKSIDFSVVHHLENVIYVAKRYGNTWLTLSDAKAVYDLIFEYRTNCGWTEIGIGDENGNQSNSYPE